MYYVGFNFYLSNANIFILLVAHGR